MPDQPAQELNGVIVTVDFVRHRNAMLVRADLGPLFTDFYLHVADHKLRYTPEQAALFKTALRPSRCTAPPAAQRAHRLDPQFPGAAPECLPRGRQRGLHGHRPAVHRERAGGRRERLLQRYRAPARRRPRRSVVNFQGSDVFAAVGGYYARSEQQPVRFFDLGTTATPCSWPSRIAPGLVRLRGC